MSAAASTGTLRSAAGKITRAALGSAAGAAIAYGTGKAVSEIEHSRAMRKREERVKAMTLHHPELAQVDPVKRDNAYAALVQYAPTLAKDPYVGGELILSMSRGRSPLPALREARQLEMMAGSGFGSTVAGSVGRSLGENIPKAFQKNSSYARHVRRETTEADMRKEAFMSNIATPVIGALSAAAVSYGIPAAVEAVRAARIRANRDKYLSEMKKVHPDMRSMSEEDLHIAYNSIAHHTPDVLKDPLLGGQTLKQMAQFRMANVSALNEISRLRGQRPLDVAFQTATNYLGQGMMDASKAYGQHQDMTARNKVEEGRLKLERDKLTAQDTQFKDRQAAEQARYEADRAYARHRDSVSDAVEQARQATAFQQAVDRAQPVDPTLYQGARGLAFGSQPVIRADTAQARLRVALDPNKNPAPAPYRK